MTEKEIIEKIINKDQETFKIFVSNHKNDVFNICHSFLQNYHDAEEVTQDVFVEIFYSLHNFKFKSSLKTWIYKIATGKSIDFLRKKKSKKRFANIVSFFSPDFDITEITEKNYDTPENKITNYEFEKLIKESIEKLPENQRAAITLSSFEDLSYKEISVILGVSSSAVESLIQRARKNLIKIISKAKE